MSEDGEYKKGRMVRLKGPTRLWGMRAKVKDADVSEGSDMIEACFDDRMMTECWIDVGARNKLKG